MSRPKKTPQQELRAKPFLKWAGGKTQLIEKLMNLLPSELYTGEVTKYVEPFVGGGAMFFHIAQSFPYLRELYISDANPDLILAYKVIQRDVEKLIVWLSALEERYTERTEQAQEEYYYAKRDAFNNNTASFNFRAYHCDWVYRAAQLIFLNRTDFNGLYRVNSKGEFNVPFGGYVEPTICDEVNLREVARVLQRVKIRCMDYSASERLINKEAFVYFDPPYRPLSNTSKFTSYIKSPFNDDAQRKLAEYFKLLDSKEAKLMLCNSDPQNSHPSDNFFEDLYRGYRIEKVDATRRINSAKNGRGKIKELVITNYCPASPTC